MLEKSVLFIFTMMMDMGRREARTMAVRVSVMSFITLFVSISSIEYF